MGLLDRDADVLPRVSFTGSTAVLDKLILEAERLVKDFVGYNIEEAEYTEYLPTVDEINFAGDSENWELVGETMVMAPPGYLPRLVLSQIPIRTIVSVYENRAAWDEGSANGDWPASALLANGRDFRVDWMRPGMAKSGILYRRSGSWSSIARSIRVIYTAGYTEEELAGEFRVFRDAALALLMNAIAGGYSSSGTYILPRLLPATEAGITAIQKGI